MFLDVREGAASMCLHFLKMPKFPFSCQLELVERKPWLFCWLWPKGTLPLIHLLSNSTRKKELMGSIIFEAVKFGDDQLASLHFSSMTFIGEDFAGR